MKLDRIKLRHGSDIGTSRIFSLQQGRFYFAVERYMGVYGQRHTVSYGIRWSRSW